MKYTLKRMKKNEVYDEHKKVLFCLLEIQKHGGGALNPFALAEVIYQYLEEHRPSNNNTERARNTAYVFACLCNTFRIMVKTHKIRDEFFVTEGIWYWYKIGRRTRETSIKLLQEMEWITFKNKILFNDTIKKEIRRHRMFTINTKRLYDLVQETHNFNCDKNVFSHKSNEEIIEKLNQKHDD